MSHRSKNKRHLNKVTNDFQATNDFENSNQTPTEIQVLRFNSQQIEEPKNTSFQSVHELIKPDFVNWIRIQGMSDSDKIIKVITELGLDFVDAKDILSSKYAKITETANHVLITLPAIYYNDNDEMVFEHLSLVLGANFLFSFQESEYPFFEDIYTAIKDATSKFSNKSASFLLASMLNLTVNNYMDCISPLNDDLEDLEDILLDINNQDTKLMEKIQAKRRIMISLQKQLVPLNNQFSILLRVENDLVKKQDIPYIRDILDQLSYQLRTLESCREIMSSLVDLYLNNNDVKMNKVMTRLTVVSTIFIPLTFICGVWGMNFEYMPELKLKYGYYFAWISMIITGAAIWYYLKRKDWF